MEYFYFLSIDTEKTQYVFTKEKDRDKFLSQLITKKPIYLWTAPVKKKEKKKIK